uniref:collagen alpha-1(I) chain-like n=1 Tax=Nyctereutes procyonoides TaxID=34880 RepID=UPI002443E0D8|nr:collagen alpha-1(I) chain-like [Nyctereutes procyonoides]
MVRSRVARGCGSRGLGVSGEPSQDPAALPLLTGVPGSPSTSTRQGEGPASTAACASAPGEPGPAPETRTVLGLHGHRVATRGPAATGSRTSSPRKLHDTAELLSEWERVTGEPRASPRRGEDAVAPLRTKDVLTPAPLCPCPRPRHPQPGRPHLGCAPGACPLHLLPPPTWQPPGRLDGGEAREEACSAKCPRGKGRGARGRRAREAEAEDSRRPLTGPAARTRSRARVPELLAPGTDRGQGPALPSTCRSHRPRARARAPPWVGERGAGSGPQPGAGKKGCEGQRPRRGPRGAERWGPSAAGPRPGLPKATVAVQAAPVPPERGRGVSALQSEVRPSRLPGRRPCVLVCTCSHPGLGPPGSAPSRRPLPPGRGRSPPPTQAGQGDRRSAGSKSRPLEGCSALRRPRGPCEGAGPGGQGACAHLGLPARAPLLTGGGGGCGLGRAAAAAAAAAAARRELPETLFSGPTSGVQGQSPGRSPRPSVNTPCGASHAALQRENRGAPGSGRPRSWSSLEPPVPAHPAALPATGRQAAQLTAAGRRPERPGRAGARLPPGDTCPGPRETLRYLPAVPTARECTHAPGSTAPPRTGRRPAHLPGYWACVCTRVRVRVRLLRGPRDPRFAENRPRALAAALPTCPGTGRVCARVCVCVCACCRDLATRALQRTVRSTPRALEHGGLLQGVRAAGPAAGGARSRARACVWQGHGRGRPCEGDRPGAPRRAALRGQACDRVGPRSSRGFPAPPAPTPAPGAPVHHARPPAAQTPRTARAGPAGRAGQEPDGALRGAPGPGRPRGFSSASARKDGAPWPRGRRPPGGPTPPEPRSPERRGRSPGTRARREGWAEVPARWPRPDAQGNPPHIPLRRRGGPSPPVAGPALLARPFRFAPPITKLDS